ncbi:hypothetical protein MOLA814_00291 [Betaproteobacteria bacterium MOLA814]|nr:hypothetical protein MOLA814_00291 [Betaproteobacteria bacterium MOLA814]
MELSFNTLDTPALTKAQLSGVLFDPLGLSKRETNDFIDDFFDMLGGFKSEVQHSWIQ